MSTTSHSNGPNIVGNYYKVNKKIGEGSFGVIFAGTNLLNSSEVAIKFEPRKVSIPLQEASPAESHAVTRRLF
ncbi:casein kinase I [Serendipita sp. 396]|nr:casein kinase I [Serendipita sp. 396]KAG8827124.1 casein kinase I [Serendipita sp. 401]KAG8835792.1 casein kinase I [Serendipita sp. 400]KAG8859675.1 casein kinase I [Serendipita sp. 411]